MVVLLWYGCSNTLIYLLFVGNLYCLSCIREFFSINRLSLAIFHSFQTCLPHLVTSNTGKLLKKDQFFKD